MWKLVEYVISHRYFRSAATILLVIIIPILAIISSHNFIPKDTHLLDKVNEVRKEHGLEPVKYNSKLARSSKRKACDMAKHHYMQHTSPIDGRLWEWVKEAHYLYVAVGENLGEWCRSNDCTALWMDSPKHREIILDPKYKDGAVSECETSIVLHFGLRPTPTQLWRMITFRVKNKLHW